MIRHFVLGHLILYLSQLLLDGFQTLVDEVVGCHDYLVAVGHPCLIVDCNECVEDVVGALYIHIRQGNVDNGRFCICVGYRHPAEYLSRNGIISCSCDSDGVDGTGTKGVCLFYCRSAKWRLEFFAEACLKLRGLAILVSEFQCGTIVVVDCYDKLDIGVVSNAIYRYFDWQA